MRLRNSHCKPKILESNYEAFTENKNKKSSVNNRMYRTVTGSSRRTERSRESDRRQKHQRRQWSEGGLDSNSLDGW